MKVLNMKIVCAAKDCKYSSNNEDASHVLFINFPNSDISKIWAHHCGRTDLLMKSNEELYLNYYICARHIEDRYYISKIDPVVIDQHAVPTLFESYTIAEKDSKSMFDKIEPIEATNSAVLSYCDIDVDIDQYRNIGISFSNICRICGETSLGGIDIFASKGVELKLKDKISIHLPINVNIDDLLPQKLCMSCYNQLETAHSLVVTSLRTDMRLKRFLNINEEISYDHKYNAIARKCSLEIAEEMRSNQTTESTSVELTSSKIDGISTNREAPGKFTPLEATKYLKGNCANNIMKEMPSVLTKVTSYDEESRNEEPSNNIIKKYSTTDITASEIQCMHCKDTFKTQEVFENHKMLCNEEDAAEQVQNDNDSNINSKQPDTIREMRFEFVTKICNICHEHFESEKHFAEHKTNYCKMTEKCIYKDSCNISSASPLEKSKKCGHCDQIYDTKKELLNHIIECHESQFLFKCMTCNRNFEKWSSLDVHEATHRIDKPYLCDLCGKSFKHSNNLRGHKRTHLDESKKKRHACEICGSTFRSRFHLSEHMNQHNGNKPYSCEKCGKAFYKRIQLRQHKLSHGLNKHICPVCGAAFNRKGNMNTHLKRHNKVTGTYTCSTCTQRFKSMSELKLHRKKHSEQDIIDSIRNGCSNKTVWQCQNCDRIFSTQAVLLNHERIHIGERMNVDCNICGKKLASKNSLMYHKKAIHSSERPHMCQFCGESFVSKETRLIHERIHTGERPYACKICKMEYKCSSNLNQHMKIHSGLKPYKCAYCDKSFSRKGSLNVHVRIHTGEKPFACETCCRTFTQKNDMIKHTRTHAGKSLRCEQCDAIFVKKKDILRHIALHEQNNRVVQNYVEVQQDADVCSVDIPYSQFE